MKASLPLPSLYVVIYEFIYEFNHRIRLIALLFQSRALPYHLHPTTIDRYLAVIARQTVWNANTNL